MRIIVLLFIFCFISRPSGAQNNPFVLGMTIGGAEINENQLPGVLNEHYQYPTEEEIAYYYQKGFRLINIPFKWERLQKTLGGDLDFAEIGEIRKVVSWAAKRNMQVILCMNNAGRYRKYGVEYIVGSSAVSRQDFADCWNKIANAFAGYDNIYGYNLMAEPHDMQAFDWQTSAQWAINSIRFADKRSQIIVSGNNYAAPETWYDYSDQLKYLKDPQDKLVFNAHCYFDYDYTGKYLFSYDQNQAWDSTGIQRAKPFAQWLKQHNKKGMIGQFGVPDNDPRWLNVMDKFLQYLKSENIAAIYSSSGKRLSGNIVSSYPLAGIERPQIKTLQSYVSGSVIAQQPLPQIKTETQIDKSTEKPISTDPPSFYLFLPGTILLPEPNGGMYKPVLKPTTREKVTREAKYRNP
ncbi:MAG: glycoside hydrolase family 5 protein [Sediminibacterium sp.]|jgi:endoglucanase